MANLITDAEIVRIEHSYYLRLWDEPGVLEHVRQRAKRYMQRDPLIEGLFVLLGRVESALEEARRERDDLVKGLRRYTPEGSPPPGGPVRLQEWVLGVLRDRAEQAESALEEARRGIDRLRKSQDSAARYFLPGDLRRVNIEQRIELRRRTEQAEAAAANMREALEWLKDYVQSCLEPPQQAPRPSRIIAKIDPVLASSDAGRAYAERVKRLEAVVRAARAVEDPNDITDLGKALAALEPEPAAGEVPRGGKDIAELIRTAIHVEIRNRKHAGTLAQIDYADIDEAITQALDTLRGKP